MTISANYPHPVQVNGFSCHNCAEVDLAKKHIDPAHPKSGPYGIDAAADPTRGPAVLLAGAAAQAGSATAANGNAPATAPYQPGALVNVSA